MGTDIESGILKHFENLVDPRISRSRLHSINEILLLTLAAVMSGCDTWQDIESYGKAKILFFKTLLPYKHGVPSDDTLRRFFAALDYSSFQQCFVSWVNSLNVDISKGVVAIDGKTSRGSRRSDGSVLHTVSAFCSNARIILGQEKISGKSNEITAIPELLELLDLRGATVTTDALGCQTKIANKIVEKGADYLFCVKKNQESTYERIEKFFNTGLAEQALNLDYAKTVEINKGRKELRACHASTSSILGDVFNKWTNLKSVIKVVREREVPGKKNEIETAYYISSKSYTALNALNDIRSHWSIENELHWVLDVSFNEDTSKIKEKNAAANMSVIRHISLNAMRRCKPKRRSLKGYKKDLGWNHAELLKVLSSACENIVT